MGDDIYRSGVVRGGLKLKKSASLPTKGGVKKRKKEDKEVSKETVKAAVAETAASSSRYVDTRTEAEKAFEDIQMQRLQQKIEKTAAKSHKEKVAEFNKYLDSLSEHFDIPRVGPG